MRRPMGADGTRDLAEPSVFRCHRPCRAPRRPGRGAEGLATEGTCADNRSSSISYLMSSCDIGAAIETDGLHHAIREARQRAGLTQRALAMLARTSQATVARYESGDVSPTLRTFERLIGACGFELDGVLRRCDSQLEAQLRAQLARSPHDRVVAGLAAAEELATVRGAVGGPDAG